MEEIKNQNLNDKVDENYKNPMGYAPILPLIMKMSIPSIFAMLITALYNIVDSIYVAQLSETALSAVSLVYPVQLLNVAIFVGTGVGLSSLISRRLGEKRIDAAQNAVNHGIIICNLEWILFLLFGLFGSMPFCLSFSDPGPLVDQAAVYCKIICIGTLFLFNAQSCERIMQSCGNMLFPMLAQIAGTITNIVLDPIMIFGKYGCSAMGVAGAAYATVIGQFVAMIAGYIFLYAGKFPVKINFKGFKFHVQTVKEIFQVGIPAIIMQAISSVTTIFQNKILIGFSDTAVAVLGIYFKLQSFAFMPVFGMNQGIMPIMGFNYGAKNKKRLLTTLKYALIISVGFMCVITVLFQIIPDTLISMFNPSEEMMAMGVKALRIISVCFPFAVCAIIPGAMFQATAHGSISMFNSILRQLVVIIPAAYILSGIMGVDGVWWAYPCAEIMSLTFTSIMFIRLYNKELKYL